MNVQLSPRASAKLFANYTKVFVIGHISQTSIHTPSFKPFIYNYKFKTGKPNHYLPHYIHIVCIEVMETQVMRQKRPLFSETNEASVETWKTSRKRLRDDEEEIYRSMAGTLFAVTDFLSSGAQLIRTPKG